MGTSNSYNGPGGNTPLVPSWLGGADQPSPPTPPADGPDGNDGTGDNDGKGTGPDSGQDQNANANSFGASIAANGSSDRFREARSNFTRFAKSGGSNRGALGRAISSYVSKASGGARKASQRMGSSRRAAIGLVSFLNSVSAQGTRATLEALNFSNLVGRSIEEVFVGLVDHICPDGGTVDEGIARNAFIETIADLADQGITDLDSLTSAQIQTIIEIFATRSIEARLCNDIGTKICIAPENIQAVERAQEQLHDFIARSVSDALNRNQGDLRNLNAIDTTKFVERIYEESFKILEAMGNFESDNE